MNGRSEIEPTIAVRFMVQGVSETDDTGTASVCRDRREPFGTMTAGTTLFMQLSETCANLF